MGWCNSTGVLYTPNFRGGGDCSIAGHTLEMRTEHGDVVVHAEATRYQLEELDSPLLTRQRVMMARQQTSSQQTEQLTAVDREARGCEASGDARNETRIW